MAVAINWEGLLWGELLLTGNVFLGLALGELLLGLRIPERLLGRWMPTFQHWGMAPDVAVALALSLGSGRSGTALLAAALREGRIFRDEAVFGTLLLAFPAYLRRWITTAVLSLGLAGIAGGLFALILLLRSLIRFLWILAMLRNRWKNRIETTSTALPSLSEERSQNFMILLFRTLPWAWSFFALTYVVMPWLEDLLRAELVQWTILPPEGWAVALAGMVTLSASFASAGGSLAAGTLSTWQALFALLCGNLLGLFSRNARQNGAFWFGLFPRDVARDLLGWQLATQLPLVLLSLGGAFLPVWWGW